VRVCVCVYIYIYIYICTPVLQTRTIPQKTSTLLMGPESRGLNPASYDDVCMVMTVAFQGVI